MPHSNDVTLATEAQISPLRTLARACPRVISRSWYETLLVGLTLPCLILAGSMGVPSATVMVAIAAAAALSSIGGFAFSALCGAVLFHLTIDPVQVVEIMMLCSVANQAAMVWSLRRAIEWRSLATFLFGGALGLPAGIGLLLHADHSAYKHALGAFLLLYGVYMLLRRPIVVRWQHPALDIATGALGGVTGGAIGFPGAFITIWCAMKGWDKERQRAVFQPFILIMQVAALLTLSFVHGPAAGHGVNPVDLLYVPGSLLGTAAGLLCYRTLSDRHFARAINLLLIISGVSYLV
ncbi:sulfite exporter TauE/SafE family protein [Methylobacterium phyllosphaerae]